MTPLIVAIVAGILVGLLVGGLGGGGAILTVPVLVYGLGKDAHEATTASLVIVGVSALVGLVPHLRQGNVRLSAGLVFGVIGIGGSYVGSRLSRGIDGNVLLTLFAVLLLVVAVTMVRKTLRRDDDRECEDFPLFSREGGHVKLDPARLAKVALAGTGVGLLTGFFGVGGGFAIVPALTLALGFCMPYAVGTSLVVIALNSASSYMFHRAGGTTLDWGVVVPFAAMAVIGALAGGRLMTKVPRRTLSLSFAAFLVLVALYTAVRSLPALVS